MRFKKRIALAVENILANRTRSILTSLGIIIGTATVIVVIAIGLGAQEAIARQYSNLSVTSIFINTGPSVVTTRLSAKDADAIMEKSPSTARVAPHLIGRLSASMGTVTAQASIVGATPIYKDVANIELRYGRFFTEEEVEGNDRVVVLGPTVTEDLFGDSESNPVGEFIRINGRNFEVIGAAKFKGGSVGPVSLDESIFMPFTVAQKQVLGASTRVSLNADAKSVDVVGKAVEEITTILRDEHRLPPSVSDDFRVRDMGSNLKSAQQSSHTMTILLTGVAAIVLIVSGIGIMNIMLVSVTERTREIGIRKAIGARRKDILSQFLIEAVLISLFGGIVGVLIGVGTVPLANYASIEAIQSIWGIVLAFLFSILFGVFFGYYPAQKAAKLDAIVALRYE
ncbi:MAG: hypothetical protein A2074_04310 [Candidatus Aquicultor primus]|uniref:FtsX-like permease family protein n=1 Tax=Candidatus Aquicultor primus TaxID=1797195 RepID=A0A1F2UI97_9ACTN|nr:MAG: hypothetical protein A2074_04310 [Candidatus Aquicultor primus]